MYFGQTSWNINESKKQVWLTPRKFYNSSEHCGSSPYGWGSGHIHLDISKPLSLPQGLYLICGDRAWQGIPHHAYGGPCYLGKLSLMLPSYNHLIAWDISKNRREKRQVSELDDKCDDEVELWSRTARFFAALLPPVGTAQALTEIQHLACWTAKQANVTTQVLSQMAQDMSSLRQAILQSRAAIDYLLLAQSKGCEDFEGMCCFNLSDHSDSIHKQLEWLQDHAKKITVNHNPLDDWLMSFGISAWVKDILKIGITIVLIVVIVLCMGPCIIQCFSFQIRRMANAVFEKKGGDVGSLVGALTLQAVYRKLP